MKYSKKTCPKSDTWFVNGGRCGWGHECAECSSCDGTGLEEQFFHGSRPLESCEADEQWFIVGPADAGLVGDSRNIAFPSWELAVEYIQWKNKS